MSNNTNPGIIICGAGPTGLMLACQLARHGVSFVILDKNKGPSVASKAMVVQARTLELYDQMGIASEAVSSGQPAMGANIHVNAKLAASIPLGDIGKSVSPFPYVLSLGQDQNERILGEKLKSLNHAIAWDTELLEFTQTDAGVTAKVRQNGQIEERSAKYLIGCDGAHSAVRHGTGIDFPGAPYEQVFFVADITATGLKSVGHLNIFIQPAGFHLLFPLPGENHYRLIGVMPDNVREKEDLTFEELSAAVSPQIASTFSIKDHGWWSRYKISHRVARTFRKGRALLAGDAGHIHSPAGGQGMNTGLQDACNLAWKLAMVCKGISSEKLLDSYCVEREAVAQRLISTTDRAFTLAVSQRIIPRIFRSFVAAIVAGRVARLESARRFMFGTVSQTLIQYRESPVSQSVGINGSQKIQAGDRFPWMNLEIDGSGSIDVYTLLRDTSFHAFALGLSEAELSAASTFCKNAKITVPLHVSRSSGWQKHGFSQKAFLIVRPDGYIGYLSSRFDEASVNSYFKDALNVQ